MSDDQTAESMRVIFNESDVSDSPGRSGDGRCWGPFGSPQSRRTTANGSSRLLAVDEGVAAIVRALRESGELANT